MTDTIQAFNLKTPEKKFLDSFYEVEYSGGKGKIRTQKISCLIFENLKPYLYIFHENTTPQNPVIKREDVVKLKKILQGKTNVSVPVKSNDILKTGQVTVTSVDSEARRSFFELIDTASDEFSDGGKDITPDEQIEIIDQFLKWFNKGLPWSKPQKMKETDLKITN